jgi:hypothetical protein
MEQFRRDRTDIRGDPIAYPASELAGLYRARGMRSSTSELSRT